MLGLIITGVIVVLLVAFIGASYIKCPPDMVYIISGLKKEPRMITGKATLRIPFFERVDKLTLELIQIDVKAVNVPTADFINVDVDAVANVRIPNREELIKVAARHFLNQSTGYIADNVQQVLEGNMREIIGQMALVDLVNNKQLFSQKIQENAQDDINNIGLEIVNLNVQSCTDDNDAINDLGIDNLVKIKKAAKIARAQSEKEIKIAEAKADEEGAKARAEADARIAEQQKELKLKKASFKIEQDKKNAEADAILTNIFDGCSNSGDIIIKGNASQTAYAAIGGIYGAATGNSQIIILNGFTNSGDIIFEGEINGVFTDDTAIGKRNFLDLGGLFGHVGSAIVFSNADNPTWTGNIVNTGKIIANLLFKENTLGEAYTISSAQNLTWGEVAELYTELAGTEFEWIDEEEKLDDGKVVCDVTLTASYTSETNTYTVTWVDENGDVLETSMDDIELSIVQKYWEKNKEFAK